MLCGPPPESWCGQPTESCLTASGLDVALLATLLALLILLVAVFDLVIRAAAAVAQLTLGAVCYGVACLTAIEATFLAHWAFRIAFFLLARAAHFCDVSLLAALATVFILLGAIITGMVSAAAAAAFFWFCAVRHCMTRFTTIETLLLADRTLLLLTGWWLVARAALLGDVPLLATLLALLVLLVAVLDLVVGAAAAVAKLWRCAICHCVICLAAIEATLRSGLRLLLLFSLALALALALLLFLAEWWLFGLAFTFAFSLTLDRLHVVPIGSDLTLLVLFGIMPRNVVPGVGLAVLRVDTFLLRHCRYGFADEIFVSTLNR